VRDDLNTLVLDADPSEAVLSNSRVISARNIGREGGSIAQRQLI
jgi:hypothetical protein